MSKVKEAIAKYKSLQITGDTRVEDAPRLNSERARWDDVIIAMEKLSRAVNVGDPGEVAQAMAVSVERDHRTLQALVVNAMLKFLSIYEDATHDLRNQAAVESAKKITQFIRDDGIYIPLI